MSRVLRTAVKIQQSGRQKHPTVLIAYHRISKTFDQLRHHPGLWQSVVDFEKDIQYITKSYTAVNIKSLLDNSTFQSSNAAKSHVIVTVDDGDMETSQNVVDICSKYDCPATFFVNSGYLQKSDNTKYHFPLLSRYYSDDEQYGEEITQLATRARITNNPTQYAQLCQRISVLAQELGGVDFDFVDYSFLESLDSELFSTCCHGRNHERFSMMSDCWQRQALEDDIAALNELASYTPIFAIPFGSSTDWNDATISISLALGLLPMLCGGDACYSSPMPVYNRGIADVVGAKYRIEAELTRII